MQLLPVFHPCFPHCTKFTAKQQKNLMADVQHGPFSEKLSFRSDVSPSRQSAWCPSSSTTLDPVFFQLNWAHRAQDDSSAKPSYPVQSHRDRGQTSWLRRIKWVEPCNQLGGRGKPCLSPFHVEMMPYLLLSFFLVFRCNLTLSSLKLTQ